MSIVEFEIKDPKKKLEFYEQLHNENITRIENLRKENEKLKGAIKTYEILIKANNINNWNELKKWLEELQQEEFDINGFTGVCTEIRLECILDKMQKLENRKV